LPVKVELDIKTQFYDETDSNGFQRDRGRFPGTDLASEFVLLGCRI